MMNAWVYDGFEHTYRTMGVEFDKVYYESDTYLLGKELVTEGVEKSTLQKEQDGSVWIDLTDDGLDRKLLLRSDGTSVYMTQDLGTAQRRYDEFQPSKLVYVVGNEQEYHFQVLKNVLKHIGRHWFDRIYHLSYGMVELPEGKMKSREGTVVDADDLVQEMFRTAEVTTRELGKVQDFSADEAETLFRIIGLGALKYFILKVDPRKNMLFNPAESIDFNGNTGPFIQYTYARIQSVLRNADMTGMQMITTGRGEFTLFHQERNVLLQLYLFPEVVKDAGTNYNPSLIANYVYDLASFFNRFYHDLSILKEENPEHRMFRIGLCKFTGNVIRSSMWMLGIEVPDRM
jgi:arginyl-tRNA synthetase